MGFFHRPKPPPFHRAQPRLNYRSAAVIVCISLAWDASNLRLSPVRETEFVAPLLCGEQVHNPIG